MLQPAKPIKPQTWALAIFPELWEIQVWGRMDPAADWQSAIRAKLGRRFLLCAFSASLRLCVESPSALVHPISPTVRIEVGSSMDRPAAANPATAREIILEIVRNMREGLEPLHYSTLAPAIYHVYLHPRRHGAPARHRAAHRRGSAPRARCRTGIASTAPPSASA